MADVRAPRRPRGAPRPAEPDARTLKRWYPIEEVVRPYVERLDRAGPRQLKARCPLHEERTPSFYVTPELGLFHCFGCGQGGDVFTFLELVHACDFREARRRLLGGAVAASHRPPAPAPAPERAAPTARQVAVLTEVAAAYADGLARVRLLDAALACAPTPADAERLRAEAEPGALAGLQALAYLRRRGIADAILESAMVGWCGGADLAPLARRRGWTTDDLLELGLLRPPREEAPDGAWPPEHLAGRIVLPAIDDGVCRWMTGRLPHEPGAGGRARKYLGLRGAFKRPFGLAAAAGQRRVTVLEGPLDYLIARQWGLPAPVGLDGLVLRPADFRLLSGAQEVYLWLDLDAAGQGAVLGAGDQPGLAALFGLRARLVVTPAGRKDLAGLADLPNGRALAWAALAAATPLPASSDEHRNAARRPSDQRR